MISVPSDADAVGSIASGTFLEAINGTGARVHEAADTPALIAIAVPLAPKHAFARVCLAFDGMRIVDALRALSAIPARGCWLAQAAVTARFAAFAVGAKDIAAAVAGTHIIGSRQLEADEQQEKRRDHQRPRASRSRHFVQRSCDPRKAGGKPPSASNKLATRPKNRTATGFFFIAKISRVYA